MEKLKKDGNVNVITEYANNEPCLEVLEIQGTTTKKQREVNREWKENLWK